MKYIPLMIYNLIILSGTTWLIVEHNWSEWTYFAAMLFMFYPKSNSNES